MRHTGRRLDTRTRLHELSTKHHCTLSCKVTRADKGGVAHRSAARPAAVGPQRTISPFDGLQGHTVARLVHLHTRRIEQTWTLRHSTLHHTPCKRKSQGKYSTATDPCAALVSAAADCMQPPAVANRHNATLGYDDAVAVIHISTNTQSSSDPHNRFQTLCPT